MTRKFFRRSGDDYAEPLAALLPQGAAWPRDPDTVLMQAVTGLAQIWGYVDGRIADLLERESDPRATLEMLADWERNFGLPDKCVAEPLTIGDRQKALVQWMTIEGAQSREFFIAVAARIGYTITIREYSPFMCGISRCGEHVDEVGDPLWQLGPLEMRFYWKIRVGLARLTWFRVSKGQTGVDPHLRIALATDLECLIRRWKPAHTDVVFDYSGLLDGGEFAGLP
jgi:uncharacterized protein YmfQ (DUF2313 family)